MSDLAIESPAPTLKLISRLTGKSIGTISRSLRNDQTISEKTRRQVLKVANTLDYRPNAAARALVRGQHENIGWLMGKGVNPLDPDYVSELYFRMIAEASNVLVRVGYNLMVVMDPQFVGATPVDLPKMIAERHVDGLLVAFEVDPTLVRRTQRMGVPVVALNAAQRQGVVTINADEKVGIALCVEHLRQLGHRRIGFINAPLKRHFTTTERAAAYLQVMREAGLSPIPGCELNRPLDESLEKLSAGSERATALICFDDAVALVAIRALSARGFRIPHDMSVTGVNDLTFCELSAPPLTTVRIPTVEIGRIAAQKVIEFIREKSYVPQTMLIPPSLVVRGSTAAPPVASRSKSTVPSSKNLKNVAGEQSQEESSEEERSG